MAPNHLIISKHHLIVDSANSNSAAVVLWCVNYQIDLTTNKPAIMSHHTHIYNIAKLQKFAKKKIAKHKPLLF